MTEILYKNKNWLNDQYWNQKKTLREMGKLSDCSFNTIRDYMVEFNIPRRDRSESKKGRPHWAKGLTKETDKRLIIFSEAKMGNKNPAWKGGVSWYVQVHKWIKKNKQKTGICTICNKEYEKTQWSNIDHKYKHEINDWIEMCYHCHTLFDEMKLIRPNLNFRDMKNIYIKLVNGEI